MSEHRSTGRRPELLCPAGSPEVLRCAFRFGADAVYIGGESFGLRAKAKNFEKTELAEAIRHAHSLGKQVHITANILAHDNDLAKAKEYFRLLAELKPDAVLIADPGMFLIAQECCPDIPIHISTQANNTNAGTFTFWHAQGARRVVCARELSLREIRGIRENTPKDLEIEAFVHGAMCISYSGRCLLSSFMAGRDANRGECTHPCRWKYAVMEEKRPGEFFPVEENERGTYVFNSRDLCMIEHIPELIEAGIDSFKIEGRMKTALYVATVARTYRKAIDDYLESPDRYRDNLPWYREEIRKCTYRQFTTGFYFGKPDENAMVYDNNTYRRGAVFLGIIEEERDGLIRIEQKNKFCAGDEIEIMKPDGRDVRTKIEAILDEEGKPQEAAPHPKQILWLKLSEAAEEGDILRTAVV